MAWDLIVYFVFQFNFRSTAICFFIEDKYQRAQCDSSGSECQFKTENMQTKQPSCKNQIEKMIELIPKNTHDCDKVKTFFRSLVSQTAIKVHQSKLNLFFASFIESIIDLERIQKKPYLECYATELTNFLLINSVDDFMVQLSNLLERLDADMKNHPQV